jgi:hypothetical protein
MTTTPTGVAPTTSWTLRIFAALLCLGVSAIHVIDQGGIPGSKTPSYVGIGYYLLEIVGIVIAVLLLSRPVLPVWFVTIGVGAGPLLGFILSRGPGLPNYTDDMGNWFEPLGVVSMVVEGVLLILAAVVFLRGIGGRAEAMAPAASRVESRVEA